MEIPAKYDPSQVEDKWFSYWMEKGFFKSTPDDREAYTIVIPPPNVTGILHMGHMLNNTIQDVLIRRARMLGYNACWVPGTDHASIATEAKVVNKLKEQGIDKADLSREEFLEHAWEWTDLHGGIILQQLKKLGASCDWDRTNFTMNDDYYASVIQVFEDLYEKGYIYRGVRMINWDPLAQTALSDEEVIHKEVNSKLYYIRYKVAGEEDEWLTIATTRPETILGDTAICLHPDDSRYKHLHGKKAIVPIANREIPIILDDYIDIEFGTGCLKVTPAHDPNDHALGEKHNLEVIDIMHPDGLLNEHGGEYAGKDRFAVRKEIAKDLEESGYLVKTEDHVNKVGYSERTNAAIEPRLSKQWFCSMKELSKPALEHVMNDDIQFHPANTKNTYRHWMENIKDWCISRQLWWGHRIPAWYFGDGPEDFVVANNEELALEKARAKSGNATLSADKIWQDEDVLDTWFSSWLWPISTFDGLSKPGNDEIKYYYPTADLVTAPEIMFFWVARMIVAGYEYLGEKPFSNVYFTGIVRDKLGRKMSKSLGNSPNPLDLIERYSAGGVRVGMLLSSPAGNDLLFDSSSCEQGRNFGNKIWNAFRLIKGWEVKGSIAQPESSKKGIQWYQSRFNEALIAINNNFDKFRISDALMGTYKLIWDDFCGYYLEIVKPGYQAPIDQETYNTTISFLEDVLKLVHPFMPFIAEEIWGLIGERDDDTRIITAPWPVVGEVDAAVNKQFGYAADVVNSIRNLRSEKNIANKVQLDLMVKANTDLSRDFDSVIMKLGNLTSLDYVEDKVDNSFSFLVGNNEFFVPFNEEVDVEAEIKKLNDELEYTRGSLNIIMKKLGNERFVNNAPEAVVNKERSRKEEVEEKIQILETKLSDLTK